MEVIAMVVETLERDDGGREQRTSSTCINIPHPRSLRYIAESFPSFRESKCLKNTMDFKKT
jgi:hypothetical protein